MENTKKMVARVGRTAYLPRDAVYGIPDPGAYAVAACFRTLRECLP